MIVVDLARPRVGASVQGGHGDGLHPVGTTRSTAVLGTGCAWREGRGGVWVKKSGVEWGGGEYG